MSRRRSLRWLLGSIATGLALSAPAPAQQSFDRPTRLPALGRSVASADDTSALVSNPANLAFLPHGELRWSSIYLGDDALVPWQGHAIGLGIPIPLLSLSAGVRVDLMDPTDRFVATSPIPAGNYQWLTWGLAFKASDASSIGVSLQHAYSERALAHDLTSWSIGLSTRPFDGVGLSLVASDVNSPRNELGGGLDRSYDVALAIRPLGTRLLEIGLEAKYVDGDFDCETLVSSLESCSYWVPRGTLGLDIPPLGRLRGDFAISDPGSEERRAWLASAALAFYLNGPSGSTEIGGGSLFGNGLGRSARYQAHENLHTDIAFRGFREASGPEGTRFALRVRIEDTPGTREHVKLLRKLWRLVDEPALAGVVFELRTAPGQTLARVQELRDAIQHLRAGGKRVLCHLEDADGASLYLCSAADRILINPAGGIRFAGLRSQHLFFAELLNKIGVRAEFVRIGEYKSAPEQFTRTGSSEAARRNKIDLLAQHERQFVAGIAQGRRLSPEQVRQRLARGPFVASEAKAAGLVDGYAYDDELERAVGDLAGEGVELLDSGPAPRAPEHFGRVPGVALVYVEGDMIDGRSETIPLLGTKLVGSYTIAETLQRVREDPFVGAVVLRVETPGGSAMASDVIWREVQLTAHVKPVVVSMGTYAASGGYYIASPATRIFANPLTITGSIGIFYGKADVAQLLEKIGVSVEVYKTAPRADAESIFRPFTDDERKELQRKVGQFYDVFLSRVSIGRRMSKAAVDAVGRGRVWTGEQALGKRLVDELGGLRQALEHARALAQLPDHAPIVELPPPDGTLLGRLLGIEGVRNELRMPLPPAMLEIVRAIAPFAVYPPDKPMARLELTAAVP